MVAAAAAAVYACAHVRACLRLCADQVRIREQLSVLPDKAPVCRCAHACVHVLVGHARLVYLHLYIHARVRRMHRVSPCIHESTLASTQAAYLYVHACM